MKGYVYVLSNPAMPGLVKIGFTLSGGQHRKTQLRTTGVPAIFELEFEIFVEDAQSLEAAVHKHLAHARYSKDREYFAVSVVEAVTEITRLTLAAHERVLRRIDSPITREAGPKGEAVPARCIDGRTALQQMKELIS